MKSTKGHNEIHTKTYKALTYYVLYVKIYVSENQEKRGICMNGYSIIADNYRHLMEQGKISKETAEKEIRIYEFLATCDENDKCIMVDSSAFNDIIKAYLRMAVMNAEISEKSQDKVLNQLRWIFDEKQAKEVLRNG